MDELSDTGFAAASGRQQVAMDTVPFIATYRLQLRPEFGFADAEAVVPYLRDLGISHLYLSPIFEATAGSSHGYDVVDAGRVRAELGGLAALRSLSRRAARAGLGIILDIVPNHVGVGPDNAWWADILKYGRASAFATYFDIDWHAQPQMEDGVLYYPILPRRFGEALEAGDIRLTLTDGRICVRAVGMNLPLGPHSYQAVLGESPQRGITVDVPARMTGLLGRLGDSDRDIAERALEQFGELIRGHDALSRWAQQRVESFNGLPGDARSWDALERLLGAQHYRLCDERLAAAEASYRRFFDVNSLAAIRVEALVVFESTHRLLFELVKAKVAVGVRVDHIDGLYDPLAYLIRLRDSLARASAGAAPPVWVEKILAAGEELPSSWPVEGTTGYDGMSVIDGLFRDERAEAAFSETYHALTGGSAAWRDVRAVARAEVAESAFSGDIEMLAYELHRIAQRDRRRRDIPLRAIRELLGATIACFPVYRSYLPDSHERAAASVREALDGARTRHAHLPAAVVSLLEETLLADETDTDAGRAESRFRRRFQQLTCPVMAKGVEDTAFYRYARFIALNEVGGDPGRFCWRPDEAHAWFQQQSRRWPRSLLASSTHDSKRSDDVRSRLNVLTEVPALWQREITAWVRLNAAHRAVVDGRLTPESEIEYYIYQTLAGMWPSQGPGDDLLARLHEHLTKAVREAKVFSAWQWPGDQYEAACHRFLDRILDPTLAPAFRQRLDTFAAQIDPAARLNSLSALIVKCMAPGIPDFFQGCEGYRFSLTDPDNRRPVDFDCLQTQLNDGDASSDPFDPQAPGAKIALTRALLAIRRNYPDAFDGGSYEPAALAGIRSEHLFAFARKGREREVVVIVPRLSHALLDGHSRIPRDTWDGTSLALPGQRWLNLLDGRRPVDAGASLVTILQGLPFAVLATASGAAGRRTIAGGLRV
jgi:malto-oligosyltrehalose synthase